MTTELKHTPGPWELVPPNHWYIGSGWGVRAKTPEGPGWPTPSATGYYAMCTPPPHGKEKVREQEANARLIAAAPDLLEALKSLVEYGEGNEDPDVFPEEHLRLNSARAAIAKVEGKSNG